MQKPTGFDEAEAFTGEFKQLPAGAYNCIIRDAHDMQSKDGRKMLQLWLDIADGEYKDYFHNQFVSRMSKAQGANWGAVYNQLTEGNSLGYFKGLLANIEDSNAGYKFNWDEKTLVNKKIGGVFGREQFVGQNGELKFSTKCFYTVALPRVKDIKPPDDRLLDKSGSSGSSSGSNSTVPSYSAASSGMEEIDVKDDLPF